MAKFLILEKLTLNTATETYFAFHGSLRIFSHWTSTHLRKNGGKPRLKNKAQFEAIMKAFASFFFHKILAFLSLFP